MGFSSTISILCVSNDRHRHIFKKFLCLCPVYFFLAYFLTVIFYNLSSSSFLFYLPFCVCHKKNNCLGNALTPFCAYFLFTTLLNKEVQSTIHKTKHYRNKMPENLERSNMFSNVEFRFSHWLESKNIFSTQSAIYRYIYVCVNVCVRERVRERERETKRKREINYLF